MKRRFIHMSCTAALAAVGLSQQAVAGDSLVDILAAKGVLTESEAAKVKTQEKADKKKLQLGGRIQADFASYKGSQGLTMASGAEFRRARIFVKGSFDDFKYKAQYDFAGNATTIQDMYIEYVGLPVAIRIGNCTEPFTMEDNTSSKHITFMERALLNAFAPGRNVGLTLSGHGDDWSSVAGVYTNGSGGAQKGVQSKVDVSGRFSYAPIHDATQILHLGASMNYHIPDSKRTVRFSNRPESHVTGMKFVDTGNLVGVKNVTQLGVEAAAVQGPFSLQGEYVKSTVNYKNPLTNKSKFSGYYAFASWFLTGESRSYAADEGLFDRITPKSAFQTHGEGWGAWEIATRYSQLNLEDVGIAGGKEKNVTVALNWYPHSHVRWMFNWVHARTERSPLAVRPGKFGPDVFQMRAQVDF